MKAESPASPFRLVIGDILILLALLLTADVLIVMPKKIHAVVLKADYQEIFRYELIICAVLLLFALDVRFNLFTRSGHTGLRVAGWVLRIAVVLFTLVIAFLRESDPRRPDQLRGEGGPCHRARAGTGGREADG